MKDDELQGILKSLIPTKVSDNKENPWLESQTLEKDDLEKSTAQVVQSLPPLLAEDEILKTLLKPNFEQIKFNNLQNVVTIPTNYGGINTQPNDFATQDVHTNQQVKYNQKRGIVSTSWSNFVLPSKEQFQLGPEEGIVIKHLTSTVLNPTLLAKSKVMSNSISFSSSNLLQNNWTNVMLYTPKEQIFKLNLKEKSDKDGN